MPFVLVPVDLVVAIHDAVLNPGELPGLARDKSLEGALGRVENRVHYGMIGDVYDLAAAYALAIAQGHCFNDAKKRTAYETMAVVLQANGTTLWFSPEDAGPRIIALAQGQLDPDDLAAWLRALAGAS